MSGFKDHFSTQSATYSSFRPGYPPALFDWLAGQCPRRELTWDCATGSGQAALVLAEYFDQVVATDASQAQLAHAKSKPNIRYRVASAEASGLPDHSTDLITVAQAAHWFDHARFHGEVRRVSRPGGLLAIWTYGLTCITPEVDQAVGLFYSQVVGPYWPPERAHVETGYRDLPFPFEEIATPQLNIEADWQLEQLLGYLSSWSASERYKAQQGNGPVKQWRQAFSDAWGDVERRKVIWPLHIRAGRVV